MCFPRRVVPGGPLPGTPLQGGQRACLRIGFDFDPQIAGVTVPGVIGLLGLMAVPYVDRNPSTKPSDRKFAIMFFTFFLVASATLTMIGTLFRGPGFNFSYPWSDGIWFDDLKDWIFFE